MKNIVLLLSLSLLIACASKNDKLLNQFENKVAQYEELVTSNVLYGDPQLDTVYNEIDAIMNELLSAKLTENQTSRATQLSTRLQAAVANIQYSNDPAFEIDLNQILNDIEVNNAEN